MANALSGDVKAGVEVLGEWVGRRWQRWQKEGSSVRWVSNGLLAHQPYLVGRLSAKLCKMIIQPDSVDFSSLVDQLIQKKSVQCFYIDPYYFFH